MVDVASEKQIAVDIRIEGPQITYIPEMHTADHILLVVGSTGITGALSVTKCAYVSTATVAAFNISALLPPGANLSSAVRAIENLFSAHPSAPPQEHDSSTVQDTLNSYVAHLTDFLAGRTALENTSILLALCTFAVLAMSWATRFNGLGRFSPFTRSPPQGGGRVSDGDFSYITADDLRKHTAGDGATQSHSHHQRAESPVEYGPPRDTDCLMLRNKKRDFTVHFPAYSIAKNELTVGQVREHAAKKLGTADTRRVKLLYKGKNLKDDARTCRQEGLRHEAELLCTVADSMPSAEGSEDEEDEEGDFAEDGMGEQGGAMDGETGKRRRNRGKKTKRRNKREQTSGTSTPLEAANLGPPPTSSQHSRAPSPKPPGTPLTPMDKLSGLRDTLGTFNPQARDFVNNPPTDQAKRDFDHKRLSETILAQVLLKLDAVETEGDPDARATRKELVRQTQAVLTELDTVMKR